MRYGQGLDGTEIAPTTFRNAGLVKALSGLGWRVSDEGDLSLPVPTRSHPDNEELAARNSYAVGEGARRIHEVVYEKAAAGNFVLTLGGDHSVALGTVSGAIRARPDVGVIWVDAHADINVPGSSPSGNIHGMPVAFLLQHNVNPKAIPGCDWIAQARPLDPAQLVYIGLRDLDLPEKRLIKQLKIKAYTMQDVDHYGIGKIMEMTLDHLSKNGERPLHLSYDIDSCDPEIAPSTGTPVEGGLNFREANYVAEAIADSNCLVSMDMVEVNPRLRDEKSVETTVRTGMKIIKSALGERIL